MVAFFSPILFNGGFRSVELVHTSSSNSEVAQYGAYSSDRWIVVLAIGGDANLSYFLGATISGVAGTFIEGHSSGNGSGTATGTAIVVGQPSGTSGTVTITSSSGEPFTSERRFYVLRVIGYNLSSAVFSARSDGVGIPPWSVNVPANGLTLSVIQNGSGVGAISWTNLTERIDDNVRIGTKINSAAWDINMPANGSLAVDVTASDAAGATSAVIATFNPL